MDKTDLVSISSLASAVSAMAKGPRFLTDWVGKRTERRYEEFIGAAKAGGVFPENAAAMTADDLFALLRALELDMEGEKAELYGRLAYSIAVGDVVDQEKRHFIRTLRDLTFDQVQRLRKALVAHRYKLFPGVGSGTKSPKGFLASAGPASVDALAFQRWGLVGGDALTPIGERFVSACFPKDALRPESIGEREWSPRGIHIICNEIGNHGSTEFINRLSEEGHSRTIKVINGAALRGRTQRPLYSFAPLFVLVTYDPSRLIDEWESVEAITRGSSAVVVVTLDGRQVELPHPLNAFERIDGSTGRELEACAHILTMLSREHGRQA